MPKFEIFNDAEGKYRYRLLGDNNWEICVSSPYATQATARAGCLDLSSKALDGTANISIKTKAALKKEAGEKAQPEGTSEKKDVPAAKTPTKATKTPAKDAKTADKKKTASVKKKPAAAKKKETAVKKKIKAEAKKVIKEIVTEKGKA